MKDPLSDYLVPNDSNDHRPHIVRSSSLLALFFIVIVVFAGSVFETSRIRGDGHFIAAVLPSVLVVLTNDDRAEYGLSRLEHSPVLERAAQLKANDMVNRGYFDHVSPDGITPWAWFNDVGYSYLHAGENLAINFSESADVVNAWMNSEGHKMNILDSKFTETGIATAVGVYKGKEAVFVVQLFGTPKTVSVTPTSPVLTKDTQQEVLSSPIVEIEVPAIPQGVVAGSEAPSRADTENEKLLLSLAPDNTADFREEDATVAEESPVTEQEVMITGEEEAAINGGELAGPTGFTRWFSLHPTLILQSVYLIVGASILLALGLMVSREAHLRHPRTVVAGVVLIILMILLAYITREYTLPMQFFASY